MKVKVEKCTTSTKGGFIVKLVATIINAIKIGDVTMQKESKQTFYIKLPQAVAVGTETELNLDQFDVIERGFIPEPGKPEIFLKWLQNKSLNIKIKERHSVAPVASVDDAVATQY
jgi:hypothetical protein